MNASPVSSLCARTAPEMSASTKFVAGPAAPTSAMPTCGEVQVARVDRHRLGPAEQERAAEVGQDEDQRAERIQVRDRIEREPALVLRGAVVAADDLGFGNKLAGGAAPGCALAAWYAASVPGPPRSKCV